MPGSIPISNTKTVNELTAINFALAITDLLMLHRPDGVEGIKDFKLGLSQLRDWITNGFAPLDSPSFTNTPTAPTPATGNDSTAIATTAFVQTIAGFIYDAVNLRVSFTDIVDDLITNLSDLPLSAAQGVVLKGLIDARAPITDPVLEGDPQAPTPAANDNSTSIATTEFVQTVASGITDVINALDESLQLLGQIHRWSPNTAYYAQRSVNDFISAPDVIAHNGELWLVTSDFTSGSSFSEKSGATVVLNRLRMDTDLDYLELVANAQAPMFVNQELGSYLAIRDFYIDFTHALPNTRLKAPVTLHRGMCNADITTQNLVTIYKVKGSTGVQTAIGTIDFNGTAGAAGMPGVFTFNDAESVSPTTKLVFTKGDILIFKLTTKSNDLSWIRINMLGTYVPFHSPYFDPAV